MDSPSEICPGCGNIIPEWASGVCYVCVRIENDYRRYGRRRPEQRTTSPPEKPKKKKARNKRDATRAPKSVTGRPRTIKREESSEADSTWRPPPLPLFYEKEYGREIDDRRLVREGINRFLRAVYEEPRYLSQILQEQGMDRRKIASLRERHLNEFLQRLVAAWCWWLDKVLSPEVVRLLVCYYCLGGSRSESLGMLSGDERGSGISSAQLWYDALTVLRQPEQVATLEYLVVEVARHSLGEGDDS